MTAAVQADMVAAATRVTAGSADFLLTFVAGGCVAVLALATQVWGLLYVTAFFLALGTPSLLALARTRRVFRDTYPVGRTIRAEVTPDHLALSRRHGTVLWTWERYSALKVTDRAVLLRLRRAPFTRTSTEVLPRGLFGTDDLTQLAIAVPRRF